MLEGDETSSWLKNHLRKAKAGNYWQFSEETISVPLDALEPHPQQPRRRLAGKKVKELAESMNLTGLGAPLLIMKRPDDPEKFFILDGARRWAAAKMLKWPAIRCYVAPALEDYQVLALMMAMDGNREKFNPLERGRGYRLLRQDLGITQRALANLIRIPQSEISRAENYYDALQQEIQDACYAADGHRLTHNHLRQLWRLQELPNVQVEVFQQAWQEDWSSRRLREEVDRILDIIPQPSQRRRLEINNELFKVIIRAKRITPIAPESLKAQLLLMNQKFFQVYGLSMDDLADWYDRVANYIRQERRAAARLAQMEIPSHEADCSD